MLSSRLDTAPFSTQGPSNLRPFSAVGDDQPQQGSRLNPTTTPVSAYNDAASKANSASAAAAYAASLQALRQTPPISQATFSPRSSSYSPGNTFSHRQNNLHHPLPNRPQDDKLELGFLLHSRPNSGEKCQSVSSKRTTSGSTSSVLPMHTLSPLLSDTDATPAWAVPVRNIPPTCPLDGLLLNFLADRRQRALDGVSSQELIGPLYPSFLTLINPQGKQYSHPSSKIFTDMMGTFPDIATLPEQVAIL